MIKQLSVFVENKKGRMAHIAELMGDAGVDIRALSIADTSDFGILRVIVDRPDLAVKTLREAGMAVTLTDVIAVGMEDKPGSFAKIIRTVADAGIEVEYMYAFIGRTAEKAFMIMRANEPEKAVEILTAAGAEILTGQDALTQI